MEQLEDFNDRLIRLSASEDFQIWRDQVVKPELEKIEQAKLNVLALSEADVKAMILYELSIKGLFVKAFEQAVIQRELERGGQDRAESIGE